jgi:hypothetical protein
MGIYRLHADGDGRLSREPTGFLDDFRSHADGSHADGSDADQDA